MLKTLFKFQKKDSKGFTLFLAVIISAVLFLVSYAITNIALKETTLSLLNKNSELAFYAADSGVECALYWDLNSGAVSPFAPTAPAGNIECGGHSINSGATFGDSSNRTNVIGNTAVNGFFNNSQNNINQSGFFIDFSNSLNGINECAVVTVTKGLDSSNNVTTLIESRGYNTCNNNSNSRLERGIRVFY